MSKTIVGFSKAEKGCYLHTENGNKDFWDNNDFFHEYATFPLKNVKLAFTENAHKEISELLFPDAILVTIIKENKDENFEMRGFQNGIPIQKICPEYEMIKWYKNNKSKILIPYTVKVPRQIYAN